MKSWPTKPLGELITIEKGKKAPEVFTTPTKTSLRYLQIEDLRPSANLKYCEPFTCPRATKSDAIIAWDGANAGTVSCNLDGHIGSTLAILRPVTAATLSAPFLSRFLAGNFGYLQKTATGATIPHISKGALTALQLPVPPLAEQERIVKLLDEADELRKLRAQADRRTAALIPALFQEMFGDPANWKLKWTVATFGDVCSFITSGSRGWAAYYANHGARFIRVQNLAGHQLSFDDIAFVNPPDTAEARRTRVQPNDLLLAITGNTIGLSALAPDDIGEAYVSQHVAIIRPNERVHPGYFTAFTALNNGVQKQISEFQYGQTKPGLSLTQVRAMYLPLPPLPLQKEFAARVTEIRELEAGQATSRTRLEALFQSMLHRAFNREL